MTDTAERPLPLVSFVVPVLNDAARLSRLLESIAALDYPAHLVEVIVVDNGSRDGSDRVAEMAGAVVFRHPRLRVGELRNRGVARARGDVLAFVDADHEIDSGWLRAAVDTLGIPGVAAVGALCWTPSDGTWVQTMYDALRHRTVGRRDVEWLGSGNLAVRREAFEQAGGFRAELDTCEDVDLCQRLRSSGLRLVSDDRLKSVHFGDPATLEALFLGEVWRGRDNIRVSLNGSLSFRSLPSLAIPVLDLVAIGLIVLGVLAAATGGLAIAFPAAGAILGLASLRAAKMLMSRGSATPLDACRALAVACTYDLARALALVGRAGHHGPRAHPIPEPIVGRAVKE